MSRSDDADKDHAEALEELERIRKDIGAAFEKTSERNAAPFDGLLGEPLPEWPEAESARWREARRSMLDKYGEKDVLAWIEGKTGAGIPPQPSEDEHFSEHLSILRAAFYALTKGRQRAQGSMMGDAKAQAKAAQREKLRLIAEGWYKANPGQEQHRRSMSDRQKAGYLAPLLGDDVSEDTVRDYLRELRKG